MELPRLASYFVLLLVLGLNARWRFGGFINAIIILVVSVFTKHAYNFVCP